MLTLLLWSLMQWGGKGDVLYLTILFVAKVVWRRWYTGEWNFMWRISVMMLRGGNPSIWRKTWPSATLSTTVPHRQAWGRKKRKNCEEEEADVTTSQNTASVSSTKTFGIMLFTVTLIFDPKMCKTHKCALGAECSFSLLKPAIRTRCFKG